MTSSVSLPQCYVSTGVVLVSGGEISYRDEDNHDGDNDADNGDSLTTSAIMMIIRSLCCICIFSIANGYCSPSGYR